MNSTVEEKIQQLEIEDFLSGIFIIASSLVILGNQFAKKYIMTNNYKYELEAKDYYILSLILVIICYFIFLRANYEDYKQEIADGKDSTVSGVRFIGTILVLIGFICFLYYQSTSRISASGPGV